MKISVTTDGSGVIDGAPLELRQQLERELPTRVTIVGDRVRFEPTKESLNILAREHKAEFDAACRPAWARLYKERMQEDVDFSFKTQPYAHQREWWRLLIEHDFYALEWEMGLGKTKTTLDVAAYLASIKQIDALLVITLKDVHQNWIDNELPEHLAIPYKAAHWNTGRVEAGMRGLLESPKFIVASINFESAWRKNGAAFIQRMLKERRTMVVVDEAHNMKNPSAAITKFLLKIAPRALKRMTLTGTMSTGSTLDAWSQYTFLSPECVDNMPFHIFKRKFAVYETLPGQTYQAWEYNPKTRRSEKVEKPVEVLKSFKNEKLLKSMLDKHRSVLKKDDVLDLPPKIHRTRSFTMTPEMRKVYASMLKNLRAEINDHEVTAQMALVKLLRLRQITCNYVVPDDIIPTEETLGVPITEKNPRIDALNSVLESVEGKAIIWSTFRYSLREISESLRAMFGDDQVVEFHGQTPKSQRMQNVQAFQKNDSSARFFVANPQSAGTGLTLTAARDVIHYNNGFNLALRLQADDRAHRIGQNGTVTYTDLEALGTIDREIIKSLKEKKDVASLITDGKYSSWLKA